MRTKIILSLILCILVSLIATCCCACSFNSEVEADNSIETRPSLDSYVYDSSVENFEFSFDGNDEYAVTKYIGESKYVEIPSTYDDGINGSFPVSKISDQAFYFFRFGESKVEIEAVKIPQSITVIGSKAFGWCSKLREVYVPSSVKEIGFGAFNGCSSLEKITIPFVGAEAVGTLNTHFGYIFEAEGWESNGSYLPNNLSEVVVTSATEIDKFAFANCKKIKSIQLPNTLQSIGEKAFWWCEGIETLVIPKSVTSLGDSCLNGCSHLVNLTIPFLGPKLGHYVYSNIGYVFGATKGEDNARFMPSTLENVVLTNQEILESNAFNGLSGLKNIKLSDNLIGVENDVFIGCNSLELEYSDKIGYLGTENNKYMLALDAEPDIENAVLKDRCVSIQSHAFAMCYNLKSINIPSSVTSISSNAFYRCRSLESITIPSAVEAINANTFYDCEKLQTINISDDSNIYIIGKFAFYNCSSLKEFYITRGVQKIDYCAFKGCINLKTVKIQELEKYMSTKIVNLEASPFAAATELYIAGEKTTEITTPDTIFKLMDYTFANLNCVSKISVSSSVSNVGNWAFYGLADNQNVEFLANQNSIIFSKDWNYNSNASFLFKS